MKKVLIPVLYVAFFFVSIIYIDLPKEPQKKGICSQYLEQEITIKNNITKTVLKNEKGQITFAIDVGYAVKIQTDKTNEKIVQYYDETETPILLADGYHSIIRKYDDKGNNIRDEYRGLNDELVSMSAGYAIIKRDYDKYPQVLNEKYYDTYGEPFCSPIYGFGKNIEYDLYGNVSRITYLDANGDPTITKLGYAIETRTYYKGKEKNGKVKEIFYFDSQYKPICLALGQYGVLKEYDENGREKRITYLDAKGKPIRNNKGYTSVVTTYSDTNALIEQYYDLEGKPYALAEGQYGVYKSGNQISYLDKYGKIKINIKQLLYNRSWIVIPCAIIIICISSMVSKRINLIFLILYLFIIAYFTLMFRESGDTMKTNILESYVRIIVDDKARSDILKNIWLFIPMGAILYRLYPKVIIILTIIVLSIIIEEIQSSYKIGYCELDDVISNGIGGVIGFTAGRLTIDIKERINSWKHIL